MSKTQEEIVIVDSNNVVVPNEASEGVVPYSFSMEKITKSNCKICKSEHRDYVDDLYENQQRKNYTAIKHKLKELHNLDASVNSIRNHIQFHYLATQRYESVMDYSEELKQWTSVNVNKIEYLRTKIAMMDREMMMIAQQSDDLDLAERRKNADTIKKLADTILTYESKIDEFQEKMKPVNLVFNQLRIIVNEEMESVQNSDSETKKTLSKIFSRLKESVGDMVTG